MPRASSWFVVLIGCCFAGRAEAEPVTYQFIQTGSNLPGFVATASLTFADGTFNLPTITCVGQASSSIPEVNCTEPLDFGNLSALSVSVQNDYGFPPGHFEFNVTLADFHVQQPPPPDDFSYWCINCPFPSSDGAFVRFGSVNGQNLLRLTSANVLFDTDYLVFCPSTPNGGHCVASGYWEPQVQPIPEPTTVTLVFTGVAAAATRLFRRRPKMVKCR